MTWSLKLCKAFFFKFECFNPNISTLEPHIHELASSSVFNSMALYCGKLHSLFRYSPIQFQMSALPFYLFKKTKYPEGRFWGLPMSIPQSQSYLSVNVR